MSSSLLRFLLNADHSHIHICVVHGEICASAPRMQSLSAGSQSIQLVIRRWLKGFGIVWDDIRLCRLVNFTTFISMANCLCKVL